MFLSALFFYSIYKKIKRLCYIYKNTLNQGKTNNLFYFANVYSLYLTKVIDFEFSYKITSIYIFAIKTEPHISMKKRHIIQDSTCI